MIRGGRHPIISRSANPQVSCRTRPRAASATILASRPAYPDGCRPAASPGLAASGQQLRRTPFVSDCSYPDITGRIGAIVQKKGRDLTREFRAPDRRNGRLKHAEFEHDLKILVT